MQGVATDDRPENVANLLPICNPLGRHQATIPLFKRGFSAPAENELRKDFTVSERVAIAKAIEERLKEKAEARMLAGVKQNPVENFPQGEDVPGTKSRDLAADRAGFGSGKTYEAAKPFFCSRSLRPCLRLWPRLRPVVRLRGRVHQLPVAQLRRDVNDDVVLRLRAVRIDADDADFHRLAGVVVLALLQAL